MNRLVDIYPYRFTEDQPEFFIVKRPPDKLYAGLWRMIGGKVDQEENAWQAALREHEEETGLKPTRFWTVPTLNHFYDSDSNNIHLIPAFAAEIPENSKIRLNEEHIDYSWLTMDKIDKIIHWPEQQRIFRLIQGILSSESITPEREIEVK